MKSLKNLIAFVLMFALCAAASERNASDVFKLPLPTSGNVTLPLAEYNRLVDLASRSIKSTEPPPNSYLLKRADLKLHVSTSNVLGTVALDGEVFLKNGAKVPLASGVTVLSAQREGKPLPLLQENGTTTAVLPTAGEFAVTLETGTPLVIEPGRASFNLAVPSAGSVEMTLVVPGDRTNVRITPGLITRRSSSAGQTTIEAALAPGQPATIWWTTREVVAPVLPKELRFLSDVKTLVSVNESDFRIAALADITVLQGQPSRFVMDIPAGYEVTNASGATVSTSEVKNGQLIVYLNNGSVRSHQFLISMERPFTQTNIQSPFITFKDSQRETGEVLVEGAGAMELTAKESGSLKRMDVKEVNPYLRALARNPLHAAFRFHRQPNEAPALALDWKRFPDTEVIAAVAERAVVTTLVTSEGRSLTEVSLTIKNQAQPFMKVDLPQGASILSADVAGEKVKPVQGTDGNRVPLLRANFRPSGPYIVSFVFVHSGSPFARKGESELSLPKMDVPISVMEWEVFLPEQYKVKDFGGDAIAVSAYPAVYDVGSGSGIGAGVGGGIGGGVAGGLVQFNPRDVGDFVNSNGPIAGVMTGTVTDPQGAVIQGAQVKVKNIANGASWSAITDAAGRWLVYGVPSGQVRIDISAQGFKRSSLRATSHEAGQGENYGTAELSVGEASSTVEVTAAAPMIDTTSSSVTTTFGGSNDFSTNGIRGERDDKKERQRQQQLAQNQASSNVYNLQKKVSGVLPVRIDVPRAGNSYHFARALVLDEETKLTFNYKSEVKIARK
jgi:hypothetical protein